jgi:hypothetical protein
MGFPGDKDPDWEIISRIARERDTEAKRALRMGLGLIVVVAVLTVVCFVVF